MSVDLSTKHVDCDIALHFSGYGAINKFPQEKETRNPLGSEFCSFSGYGAPLLPVCGRQYDSAYVGRLVIEVDLVGEYYDAGVKYGLPMAFTVTMLA